MTSPASPVVAIIYATKGGMGDVGKFAAAHAANNTAITARVISMSAGSTEGDGTWVDADVVDTELSTKLRTDIESISVQHIDVEAADAQSQLTTALAGADAVVACLGSRQPGFGRWIARGFTVLVEAMQKSNVNRLVALSSMGIGDDFMPFRGIRVLWAGLLRTFYRPTFHDLCNMERVVRDSQTDYLLVRPVGLTPAEPPRGTWELLTAPGGGGLDYSIAKADCAAFMLQEAITPTLKRTAVTIGQPEKKAT